MVKEKKECELLNEAECEEELEEKGEILEEVDS